MMVLKTPLVNYLKFLITTEGQGGGEERGNTTQARSSLTVTC
jgi:hypothetical protein